MTDAQQQAWTRFLSGKPPDSNLPTLTLMRRLFDAGWEAAHESCEATLKRLKELRAHEQEHYDEQKLTVARLRQERDAAREEAIRWQQAFVSPSVAVLAQQAIQAEQRLSETLKALEAMLRDMHTGAAGVPRGSLGAAGLGCGRPCQTCERARAVLAAEEEKEWETRRGIA